MGDPIVILGAGLAGLSAAYHAQERGIPYLLFEKQSRPGGLVRSEKLNGFSFDYTGHLLHIKEERTRQLVLKKLGLAKAFVPVVRDSWVYMNGRYTRAPFQANLFGQPDAVIRECLLGILDAQKLPQGGEKPKYFEQWNLQAFGKGIYKHFMAPYNTKLWGIHPSKMTTGFMGRSGAGAHQPHTPSPIDQAHVSCGQNPAQIGRGGEKSGIGVVRGSAEHADRIQTPGLVCHMIWPQEQGETETARLRARRPDTKCMICCRAKGFKHRVDSNRSDSPAVADLRGLRPAKGS